LQCVKKLGGKWIFPTTSIWKKKYDNKDLK
jgi:hypothetical protein